LFDFLNYFLFYFFLLHFVPDVVLLLLGSNVVKEFGGAQASFNLMKFICSSWIDILTAFLGTEISWWIIEENDVPFGK
jgi:hypothetical protein